ncbi:MAG TPA: sugar ABC transporter substrate-binding protein [Gammaproteobacteria bacterium]|nr:sugar ABC transporter substrate-binding protein [Gammaproteobacteria bacterium]
MLLLGILAIATAGCDSDEQVSRSPYTELEIWLHSGQPAERRTLQEQVTRFNESQRRYRVNAVILPEGSYNAQVQSAAVAGKLPDILEFDGPFLYNYVWQGKLIPLDKHITDGALLDELLPSIVRQGMYQGRLYAVGTYDSGLGLFARRSRLESAGIRIPTTPDRAWTVDEFEEALARLARDDPDGAVLDLKLNYRGEWYTYAFSPVIQSAGGDLIDRRGTNRASGVLNGAASVAAMKRVQGWIKAGRVDPNLDDAAFVEGRVALSWAGHWDYARYRKAAGDDLVLLPLPDFGRGARTAQGSWAWAVTRNCRDVQGAMDFLEFLLRPEEVLAMSNANGAVPGTRSAIARSPLYRPGGPLHLFVEQLETIAVPRPRTPAYPVITSAFQQAFEDIRNGGDVQAALDRAAALIDRDIEENRGYPPG